MFGQSSFTLGNLIFWLVIFLSLKVSAIKSYCFLYLKMDLVDRDDVSENAILEELRVRFMNNEIYSSIGPIIIALNPYRNIPGLYSAKDMKMYMDSEHTPLGYHKHPPHVWTLAQSAFSHLKKTKVCQAIVISGESGGMVSGLCCLISLSFSW